MRKLLLLVPIIGLAIACSSSSSNSITDSNSGITLNSSCKLATIQVSIPNSNETPLYGPAGEVIITLTNNTGQGIYLSSVSYDLYDNQGNVISNSSMTSFTDSSGQEISQVYIGNGMKNTLKDYNSNWSWQSGETCKVTSWNQGE